LDQVEAVKTGAFNATVPLPAPLVEVLKTHREQQQIEER
jgi:hypothetical protein